MILIPLCVMILLIGVRLARSKEPRTALFVTDSVLSGLLVGMVGVGHLIAFMGHAFRADEVARSIGWPAGNPFQFEVAVANLSYAVMGLLCLRFRGGFWWATAVGQAVFAFGAAYGHFRQIHLAGNLSPGNAGAVLYFGDVAVPVLILVLLTARQSLSRKTGT